MVAPHLTRDHDYGKATVLHRWALASSKAKLGLIGPDTGAKAEHVIVACDEHYERFSLKVPTEDDKMGAGTHDEYTNIANKVYEEQNRSGWLVPVIFKPPGVRKHLPDGIRKFSYFTLGDQQASSQKSGCSICSKLYTSVWETCACNMRTVTLHCLTTAHQQSEWFIVSIFVHQEPWVGYDTLVNHLGTLQAFVQPMPSQHSASESPRVGVLSVPELRKNETELTDKWRNEVQDAMDTIQAFMQTSPDYYADFRAYRASDDSQQEGPLKRVEQARRVLRDFWRSAYKWYMDGMLPPDFFSKSNVWCARGNTFRLMVEPIDIANYYRLELWKQWPVGNRHYLEADSRPEYYTFLELQYEKYNKTAPPSSTQRALDEMDAIEAK
eukprot:jgi/Chlat1/3696/Chrsp249S03837